MFESQILAALLFRLINADIPSLLCIDGFAVNATESSDENGKLLRGRVSKLDQGEKNRL